MGRSGYTDDFGDDQWQLIRWRGAVRSAIRGNRGQKFLRRLLEALDAMPEKRLVAEDLANDDGEVCTLGCALRAGGIDPKAYDPEDHEGLGKALDIAPALVKEIEYENDDWGSKDIACEKRWEYMREWVAKRIKA